MACPITYGGHNQHAKFLDQKSPSSKVIVWTDRQSDRQTHIRTTTLTGPVTSSSNKTNISTINGMLTIHRQRLLADKRGTTRRQLNTRSIRVRHLNRITFIQDVLHNLQWIAASISRTHCIL